MNKEIFYGKEARQKLLSGVKKIVDAIKVTMGASGKCVLIGDGVYGNDGLVQLPTIVTKDGYSVAKHFQLTDVVENRGAMIVKEAAYKTVEQAGDATTATSVLAGAIIEGGMELIDNGANSQEVKKGIDKAVEDVVAELKNVSIPVAGDNNKIFQVATVSANNDTVIGRYIADAFAKIGEDGVIDIEQGKTEKTEIKVSDGYKWDKGWVSPLFVNNPSKQQCEFLDPLILLYEKKITHHTQITQALEIAMQKGKPLVIICEDSDEEGLAFLTMNNIQKRVQVCVVKSPEFGELRRESMEDLALLTGGTYISDVRGIGVKEVQLNNFGRASKVIVSKEETVIIGAMGDKNELSEFTNELKMNLVDAKTEEEKRPIEKRIAKLTGGVAVIQVGAATETELSEKLDRYDDAIRATKAAIAEGFVAGGGTAFIRISESLNVPHGTSDSFKKGYTLVASVLSKPFKQIIENAGGDVDKIYAEVKSKSGNFGYNVKTDSVENLIESGIIDSTKALRCALVNAASVAGMALTSECLIITTH